MVLATNAASESAEAIVRRVQELVNQHNSSKPEPPFVLAISIGSTTYDPAHPETLEDVLKRADQNEGSLAAAPHALTASDFGIECIEGLIPESAESFEPSVNVTPALRLDRIEAAGAFGANVREAIVPEHAQVLRHRGLRDAELGLNDLDDVPRGELAAGEQFENASPDGIGEDLESMHQVSAGSGE